MKASGRGADCRRASESPCHPSLSAEPVRHCRGLILSPSWAAESELESEPIDFNLKARGLKPAVPDGRSDKQRVRVVVERGRLHLRSFGLAGVWAQSCVLGGCL